MRLSTLAEDFNIRGPGDPDIPGLSEDSRRITPGMLFVAVPGTAQDGHAYVAEAIARGAAAIVAERSEDVPDDVPLVRVDSARRALAVLAARFYGAPAEVLQIVGFTGTFGKTSTSEILRVLLEAGGSRTGVLGSLGARYGDFHDPGNGLTTPAPVEMHRALRGLRDAGARTAIMEVTSHALLMDRARGLTFGGGLIAAIMPGEHTDFHRTYDDYVAAKRLFLDYLAPDAVLAFDADNPTSAALAAEARVAVRAGVSLERPAAPTRARSGREVGTPAAVQLREIVLDHEGARFVCVLAADGPRNDQPGMVRLPPPPPSGQRGYGGPGKPDATLGFEAAAGYRMHSPMLGPGHLRNVALAIAYATAAGVEPEVSAAALRTLVPLRRRMERYDAAGRAVLDDTAAHPDSLRATFEVADMLAAGRPASRVAVAYAIRGSRGADINRRNAEALAELTSAHRIDALIVTAALDTAGGTDRATPAEIDATRGAFADRGVQIGWNDTLRDAVRAAMADTRAGDLIVLIGAQGMNEGKRMLTEEVAGR
jgi:UDP-N-acetylmuramoyl-L-alanyl-D-glutamate--2,6-diaminopimelate ligase